MAKKNKKESKTAMPKTNGSKMGFEELFKNGAEAQASYDYPSAIELYSQALANEEINSELAYEILDERAECFERMGQFKAELDDFDKMFGIAQELGNSEMQMAIVYRQVFTAARMGENAKVKEIAESVNLNGIPRSLLRGFQVLVKFVPEGIKFRNTPSACGGDRNFEDFASLF